MRFLVLVLILVTAASTALAGVNDIKCTADTTLSLTTTLGNPVGPSAVTLVADGKAYLKFIWFKDNCTDRVSGQIVDTAVVFLRDYTPPRYYPMPSGADSVVVDMVTATELLVIK